MRRVSFAALAAALTACNGNSAVVPGSAPIPGSAPTMPSSACGEAPTAIASAPAARIRRVYQPDWAGPVLFAPNQVPLRIPAHRFCAVEGEWTVPAAKPTINCYDRHEPTDGSSLWIAIDGWSATFKAHAKRKNGAWYTYPSTDVLQAGSESDVPCYKGGPLEKYKTSAYFWIEWSGVRNIAVARTSEICHSTPETEFTSASPQLRPARTHGDEQRFGSLTRRPASPCRRAPSIPAASIAGPHSNDPRHSSATPPSG